MKAWKIFIALGLILVAVLLILDAANVLSPLTSVIGEISAFRIALGLFLLAFTAERIVKGKLHEIFLPLALIFMLFEKNVAMLLGMENPNIVHNGILVLAAILLSVGFSMLFGNVKKKRIRRKVSAQINSSAKYEYSDNKTKCSLGSSAVYIDCETLSPRFIENNLGACSVYFENTEKYAGDGSIHVENNLGSMTIHVPAAWSVVNMIESSLGNVHAPKCEKTDAPVLTVYGENNLGSVSIKFV